MFDRDPITGLLVLSTTQVTRSRCRLPVSLPVHDRSLPFSLPLSLPFFCTVLCLRLIVHYLFLIVGCLCPCLLSLPFVTALSDRQPR